MPDENLGSPSVPGHTDSSVDFGLRRAELREGRTRPMRRDSSMKRPLPFSSEIGFGSSSTMVTVPAGGGAATAARGARMRV